MLETGLYHWPVASVDVIKMSDWNEYPLVTLVIKYGNG